MIGENAAMLERAVIATLPTDRRPTEDELLETASRLRRAFPILDDDFARLIKHLHAKLAITMDMGSALVEAGYTPWLSARRASIDPFYWERFRSWLVRLNRPPLVTNTLDGVTDEILDLAGDPQRVGAWAGRGLVVGDVQSGKTGTYTALACKAADAGYRLIILLTGSLESLRRQTQERMDEGFVGLDSSEVLQQPQIGTSRAVGVGVIDQRRTAGVFTSRSRDFSRDLMTQLGFRLDSMQEPVLVVLKKNRIILENLETWLRSYNAGPDGKISAPLLLIDDEADSASINTNASTTDPTRINERVRALLALFHRSSYVGFTATPFANVFVDPDSESAMLGDDLFPRDFIYNLEAPRNYVGPDAVFGPEAIAAEPHPVIRWNDDAEPYFPAKHTSALSVPSLPPSLLEAFRSFLVVTTLRDLRGEGPSHRSMLVNVSRFTAVQDQVAGLLDGELREVQRDIRNFSQLEPEEALCIPSIRAIYDTWVREHGDSAHPWVTVQKALHVAVQPITVRSVNQRTGAASLDYRAYKDQGLRVIAVGGNSLSRGLTLEGLATSYFYRNSQMYDTLLQMGRWFGYRDGYSDLCRLWLAEEASQWYAHITAASEELRREFKRMRQLDLTPKDFGLKVRAHPDALIVTARNKMRHANTIVRQVSLSKQGIETARLRSNPAVIRANAEAASRFVRGLSVVGIAPGELAFGSTPFWQDVPKEALATFLSEFTAHQLNYDFQAGELAAFLERTREPRLRVWDVVIPQGSLEEMEFGGVRIRLSKRRVVVKSDINSILVSGSSARVGSRGIEREGLTLEQYSKVVEEEGKQNLSDRAFRAVRSKPLLLLYLLRGFVRRLGDSQGEAAFDSGGQPLVAIGLSFPEFDDSGIAGRVEYKVNNVEWRAMFEAEEDDDLLGDDELD